MSNSFAQTIELTCHQCHQLFSAKLWLIVDVAEWHNMLGQLHTNKLHSFTCPQCGVDGTVDAPLLVFYPYDNPAIIFSPAQQTSEVEDHAHALHLLNLLQSQMGSAWQSGWLNRVVTIPTRSSLGEVLKAKHKTSFENMLRLGAKDPDQGINLYLQALFQYPRDVFPEYWAAIQYTLCVYNK